MARKKGGRRDLGAVKPKRLRKQLRKAESALARAEAKRDKAQARVQAMGIIADEIRAQLVEMEKAVAATAKTEADKPATARTAGRKAAVSSKRSTSTAAKVAPVTRGRATTKASPAKKASPASTPRSNTSRASPK